MQPLYLLDNKTVVTIDECTCRVRTPELLSGLECLRSQLRRIPNFSPGDWVKTPDGSLLEVDYVVMNGPEFNDMITLYLKGHADQWNEKDLEAHEKSCS